MLGAVSAEELSLTAYSILCLAHSTRQHAPRRQELDRAAKPHLVVLTRRKTACFAEKSPQVTPGLTKTTQCRDVGAL